MLVVLCSPDLVYCFIYMDLKTVRTRSINHQHYVADIIDDNSGKAFIYPLRLMPFVMPCRSFTILSVSPGALISSLYAWTMLEN